MAAKKLSEPSIKHGLAKMMCFARKHGFNVEEVDSYRVIKKPAKQRMKNITLHSRERISSHDEEYCEILKVSTENQLGRLIQGYLIGYSKGIRFDTHARF